MRRQFFTIISGGQGCGKTTFAFKIIDNIKNQNKPVLCILPDDEEKLFWDIEEIEYDSENPKNTARELINFKTGIKKIYCDNVKLFDLIRNYFKNGLIVIDDARVYLTSRDEPFRAMIMRRRQKNCDVLFICHGLSEIPPSCNSFVTDVILFETTDDFKKWNIANKEKYREVVARINNIAQTKNKYYSERIKLRDLKI